MTEPTLRSNHLFTLSLTVDPNVSDIGETPYGHRRIATRFAQRRINPTHIIAWLLWRPPLTHLIRIPGKIGSFLR